MWRYGFHIQFIILGSCKYFLLSLLQNILELNQSRAKVLEAIWFLYEFSNNFFYFLQYYGECSRYIVFSAFTLKYDVIKSKQLPLNVVQHWKLATSLKTAYPSSSTDWVATSVKLNASRRGILLKICDKTARRWWRWMPPSYKIQQPYCEDINTPIIQIIIQIIILTLTLWIYVFCHMFNSQLNSKCTKDAGVSACLNHYKIIHKTRIRKHSFCEHI